MTLEVKVQNDQIENAIKSLKRQLIRDGVLKELKNRRAYEKPSVKKKRKQREARRTKAEGGSQVFEIFKFGTLSSARLGITVGPGH